MSDILIKSMEMSTSCFSCPMSGIECCGISRGSYIEYRDVDIDVAMKGKPDWCPLVEIPPHGDLIERKAAYDSLLNGMVMTRYLSRALDCVSEFYVPTIIEAEPEVHDCENCKWFGGLMCDHVDENYKCLGWEAEEGK